MTMGNLAEPLIPFLAILNSFALCLYLAGLMTDQNREQQWLE